MVIELLGTSYLGVGAVVAVVFLVFGLGRIDENAENAWIFRPLMIPGVLLIWPLVLWRWHVMYIGEDKLRRHRIPRALQFRIELAFVIAIPVVLIAALAVRQDPTALKAPVQLEVAE